MKNFERSEIQPILQTAVANALATHEIEVEGAHVRRLVRSLLRLAAKLVVKTAGTGNPEAMFKAIFFPLCAEAFGKEFQAAAGKPVASPEAEHNN